MMASKMNSVKTSMNEVDNECLGSELWHACAGGMVQMPRLNSKVFYFPQGHAEHAASGNVNFGDFPRIPPYILCQVSATKFMADEETDEVYVKMRLIPFKYHNTCDFDDDNGVLGFDQNKNMNQETPNFFAKTLTQSDANNGGGFSVPRYCAETIFPKLNYEDDPPVQIISVKDVHGRIWQFRHIYRGTPRRHLLTTGWSSFVNHKKLVAGDSIVFLRAENDDLCVGIRRVKRGMNGGVVTYGGGISGFIREDDKSNPKGKLSGESVMEAVNLAANFQPFEVFYYPRASTPEFCVTASTIMAAMRIQWCPGMRFKMAFETEDSSRTSWFMGTVSSVRASDHIRWPNSPWRLLEVSWDEQDLLQNVKRVNPWLVEMVSNMHISPFSPPRKKLRIPSIPDFPIFQHPISSLLTTNNIPTSIQGARHNSQIFGSDHHLQFNKTQPFSFGVLNHDHLRRRFPSTITEPTKETNQNEHERVSCALTIGNSHSTPNLKKKDEDEKYNKKPLFVLFGQPILSEEPPSESWSGHDGSVVLQNGPVETSSDEAGPWFREHKHESKIETDHCKVLTES